RRPNMAPISRENVAHQPDSIHDLRNISFQLIEDGNTFLNDQSHDDRDDNNADDESATPHANWLSTPRRKRQPSSTGITPSRQHLDKTQRAGGTRPPLPVPRNTHSPLIPTPARSLQHPQCERTTVH